MAAVIAPLPCPFCGALPEVGPANPHLHGNAFGYVQCVNHRCASFNAATGFGARVRDGADSCDDRGSAAYKRLAIQRWNRRKP